MKQETKHPKTVQEELEDYCSRQQYVNEHDLGLSQKLTFNGIGQNLHEVKLFMELMREVSFGARNSDYFECKDKALEYIMALSRVTAQIVPTDETELLDELIFWNKEKD